MTLTSLIKGARELPLGDDLETIFKMQDEIDYVNSSVYNRKLSKKIGYDVIHYLNEGYLLYGKTLLLSLKAEGDEKPNLTEMTCEHNLSIAKALNSLVRLMTSSNVGHADIYNYYETLLTEKKVADIYLFKDNLMGTAMSYARYVNVMGRLYNNPEINLRPAVTMGNVFDEHVRGGRIMNEVYFEIMHHNYWQFTSQLFLAINKLPTDIEKNFSTYQNQLMEAWLHFFKILDFLGNTPDSVGRMYSIYYHIKTQEK